MGVARTLDFIVSHPLNRSRRLAAIARYVGWQVASRVANRTIAVPFGRHSCLMAGRGMAGATGNVYCGLQDFAEMAFTMLYLRPGDLFVDVGANIGSYTVLAAEAGADCIAFEPAPDTFRALQANIAANRFDGDVLARNVAVGREPGELLLSRGHDTMNRIVAQNDGVAAQPVPVVRLDDEITRPPALIKIDVEGFEAEVVAGAERTFSEAQAVIMEVNGGGPRLYGFSDEALMGRMADLGFTPVSFRPHGRHIAALEVASDNVLLVRDQAAAQARVLSAAAVRINGVSF